MAQKSSTKVTVVINFCVLFALRVLHSFHSMFHRLHLSSSAASVPVECMFSSAGLVANGKRWNLSAEKLHRICFVHDNYKLLF